MNNTKFPKFRNYIANLDRSPRDIALAVCNKASRKVLGLSMDDLPETFAIAKGVDEMEATIANWGIPRNPSERQIVRLYEMGLEVVQDIAVAEGFSELC